MGCKKPEHVATDSWWCKRDLIGQNGRRYLHERSRRYAAFGLWLNSMNRVRGEPLSMHSECGWRKAGKQPAHPSPRWLPP